MTKTIERIIAQLGKAYRSQAIRMAVAGALLYLVAARVGVLTFITGIEPVLLQSAAFKLGFVVAGIIIVQSVLAAYDNRSGVSFKKDFLPKLMEGNQAVATYLGMRFVGVCILVGLVA